jgi:hypothetical protein
MPSGVEFYIPFESEISPDAASAEAHTLKWLQTYGLLQSEAEAAYFASMRIGAVTARMYPYARGADLALMNDWVSFMFVINDQVGSIGDRRAKSAEMICHDIIALLDQGSRHAKTPFGRAFCALWKRFAEGMPPARQARTRRHLRESFGSYIDRIRQRRRIIPTAAQYIEQRRTRNFFAPCMDLGERAGHFEAPARALQSPLVKDMLDHANQLSYLPHEVYGVEREEARGEVDNNFLLALEHETGCSREEGIAKIQSMVYRLSERFLELQAQIQPFQGHRFALTLLSQPGQLGLDPLGHEAVDLGAPGQGHPADGVVGQRGVEQALRREATLGLDLPHPGIRGAHDRVGRHRAAARRLIHHRVLPPAPRASHLLGGEPERPEDAGEPAVRRPAGRRHGHVEQEEGRTQPTRQAPALAGARARERSEGPHGQHAPQAVAEDDQVPDLPAEVAEALPEEALQTRHREARGARVAPS